MAPSGHGLQEVAPSPRATVPNEQRVQNALPGLSEKKPWPHFTQPSLPRSSEFAKLPPVPAGQGLQVDFPLRKKPDGQRQRRTKKSGTRPLRQTLHFVRAPPLLTLPEGHSSQRFVRVLMKKPASHRIQAPFSTAKESSGHCAPTCRQTLAPGAEVVPAGQSLHIRRPLLNVPALHGRQRKAPKLDT